MAKRAIKVADLPTTEEDRVVRIEVYYEEGGFSMFGDGAPRPEGTGSPFHQLNCKRQPVDWNTPLPGPSLAFVI